MENNHGTENRIFSRTDRPGSGLYRGDATPGIAFDDYRAADEHELHHRREAAKPSLWQSWLNLLKPGTKAADTQAEEKAMAALAHDSTLETTRVRITARGNMLTVSGSVPSRWMKERITDCLLELGEGRSIRNILEIHPEHTRLPQEES